MTGGGQVPAKPDYLTKAGGDVWAKCSEGHPTVLDG